MYNLFGPMKISAITGQVGTTGAVFAKVTDDILKDSGISNTLHRMQILHARDDLMGQLHIGNDTSPIPAHKESSLAETMYTPEFLNTDREYATKSKTLSVEKAMDSPKSPPRKLSHGSIPLSSKSDSTIPPIQDYRSSLPTFERQRVSGSVEVEGGKYMAMMKVLPSGALIRVVGETLPLAANPLAKLLVDLYKLQKVAFYNADNARRFIKRCCQIQSLFSARKLKYVVKLSVIKIIGEVLEEAKDLFRFFSGRGWLVRVVRSPPDKREFQRLDDMLVQSCLMGHITMSEQSKENLKQAPRYTNDVKVISNKLDELGGMEGLRSQKVADKLLPVLVAGKCVLEEAVESELEIYDDSIDNSGPYTVIRNQEMRSFWRRSFPGKEHVSWDDFWRCFPRNLNSEHASDLSEVLSSRNHREILQSHLARSSPDMLNVSEVDFVFAPHIDVPETVRKLLRVDMVLTNLKRSGSDSLFVGIRDGPIDDGYLFNFPDELEDFAGREELMMKLNLGMQDRGTKIVVLAGPPGIGKKSVASSLSRSLISVGHWTEAYWVDLRGIRSQTTAGFQIMSALGILRETPDQQYLFGFLERQQEKPVGLVITGCRSLLESREKECAFIDYIENMINASKNMQVILTTTNPLVETRPTILTHEIGGLEDSEAADLISTHFQATAEEVDPSTLLEHVTSYPACLRVFCGMASSGDVTSEQLLDLINNADLPDVTSVPSAERLRDIDAKSARCLTACILSLEEELLNVLMVLSIFPSSFVDDTVLEILGDQCTEVKARSSLRKLCNRGMVQYNTSTGRYDLHLLVRDAGRALATILGIDYEESRKVFVEYYIREVIYVTSKMQKNPWAQKAGYHIFHRDLINIEQVINWASIDPPKGCLSIYVNLLWDEMALLKSRMDVGVLEGFCEACKIMAEDAEYVKFKTRALIQQGCLMGDQDRLNDAEETLRDALSLCLTSVGADTLESARCYQGLGMVLHKKNMAEDALEYYKKALLTVEQLHGKSHIDMAKIHTAIGDVRKTLRRHAEARESYEEALKIKKTCLGEDHLDVAKILAILGQQCRLAGDTTEAETVYRRCLDIEEAGLGTEHPQVADTLVDMAALLRQLKKYPAAEQMLRRALSIREKCMGPNHPQTAACVLSLSLLLKAVHKHTAALPLVQRNLQMRLRMHGPAHIEVSSALTTIAELLLDMGRYTEAYKHCKRGLDIRQKQMGSLDPSVAQASNSLGVILRHMGKLTEAEKASKSSLDGRLASFHPNHPEVASSLNGLAEIEKDLGRLEEAEGHCREGLAIRVKVCKGQHPLVSLSQSTLAAILKEKGDLDEAEQFARGSLETREKHFGQESPYVASCLDILASILLAKGEITEAEESAHRAVDVKRKVLGQNHPEVAKSLIGLGLVFLEGSKPSVAKNKFARAKDVCSAQLGDAHPLTEQALGLMEKSDATLATKKSSAAHSVTSSN
ncbi:hypothetical protein BSKO_03173 [Bryopsis sp. KO-2023]|nr:hypothetical protein BSKO_03173 [Bryopsis sp. KO-2023]